VRDVYVRISYMGPSTHLYPVPDPTLPGCPFVSYAEPATGHRPLQDSIDLVVRAFAGAHLTPAARPCGKPGDTPCGQGTVCVDFACLPLCATDSECAATCNADCMAQGGAVCVSQGTGANKVCRKWRLHVDPLPAVGVAHRDIVSYGPSSPSCANTAGGGSMTPDDQVNLFEYKTPANFDPRDAAFKHFILFAHDNTCYGTGSPGCGDSTCPAVDGASPRPATSGLAEVFGNDAVVSLGTTQLLSASSQRIVVEAAVLMHELGHNLGLNHGGPSPAPSTPTKVNYLSVMNYLYGSTGIPFTNVPGSTVPAGSHPDFSHQPLVVPLNESSLQEPIGVGPPGLQEPNTRDLIRYIHNNTPVCPCPTDPCTGLPYPNCAGLGSGYGPGGIPPAIDWNCDGIITGGVVADINGNGIVTEIHDPAGTADWIHLFYEFQCQQSYVDGPSGSIAQAAEAPQRGRPGLDFVPPLEPAGPVDRCDVQDQSIPPAGRSVIQDRAPAVSSEPH